MGRNKKYGERTVMIGFRIPESKKDFLKKNLALYIDKLLDGCNSYEELEMELYKVKNYDLGRE